MAWPNANLLPKFQLKSNIFFEEDPFENVVYKMATVFSQPQCVKQAQLLVGLLGMSIYCVADAGCHHYIPSRVIDSTMMVPSCLNRCKNMAGGKLKEEDMVKLSEEN